jgi:membrane protein
MQKPIKDLGALLKETCENWWDHKAFKLAASLSYYTIFSLAPVLVLVVAVAGLVLGRDAIEGRIVEEMQGMLGHDAAQLLQTMLAASSGKKSSIIATVIGAVALLVGATSVMMELQDSLNTIWKVVPQPIIGVVGNLKSVVKDRLLSLSIVLSFGFVLLVSLGMSAALAAVSAWVNGFIPAWVIVGEILSEVISFGSIALFIALLFKFLPAAKIAWRDVWLGATLSSALFHGGKYLIGIYIGKASVTSTFGATGSLAALLIWVYYSSLIMLFGAEFTRAYATRFGSGLQPDVGAMLAPDATPDMHEQVRQQKAAKVTHRTA